MTEEVEALRKAIEKLTTNQEKLVHIVDVLNQRIDLQEFARVPTLHTAVRRGASVEEQNEEPVCECGHFKFWHSTYMSLYNPDAPLKCMYDGCDCDSFRPPNGS